MTLVCLICTDEITSDCSAPKCGHIFHSECLKHWLQLNKSCPQCRAKCTKNTDVIKLFLNGGEGEGACGDVGPLVDGESSPGKLRSRLCEYERNLSERETDLSIMKEEFTLCKEELSCLKATHAKLDKRYAEEHRIVSQLSKELKSVYAQFDKVKDEYIVSSQRCQELESSAKVYRLIQSVIENGKTDIEFLVASYGDGPKAVQSIAQSLFHLKKNYDELRSINDSIRSEKEVVISENRELEAKCTRKSQQLLKYNSRLVQLSEECSNAKRNFHILKKSLKAGTPPEETVGYTFESPQKDCTKQMAKRPKVYSEDTIDPLCMDITTRFRDSNKPSFTDKEPPGSLISISKREEKVSHFNTIPKETLPLNLRPTFRKFSLTDTAVKRKFSQNKKIGLNPSKFRVDKTIF